MHTHRYTYTLHMHDYTQAMDTCKQIIIKLFIYMRACSTHSEISAEWCISLCKNKSFI